MFQEEKLRQALAVKGISLQEMAKILGINPSTLYRKMVGESDFYRNEMVIICKTLEIQNISEIFFAEEIAYTQN